MSMIIRPWEEAVGVEQAYPDLVAACMQDMIKMLLQGVTQVWPSTASA